VEERKAAAEAKKRAEELAATAAQIAETAEAVARYAAEAGVRSLEFRTDGNAWRVEVNPEFAAIAIFRNARFIEARFLFSPQS
jgi:hypothetical protein